ncbi:MAG: tetratricopeptide repeat protein, partial [Planctomycetota bacterium]
QRLRYASVLSDNESYERALETWEGAAELAETPEDREQLLTQRIKTYKDSGTLDQRIAQVAKDATSAGDFRELAMMHSAGGQMTDAATAIDRAIQLAPEDTSVLLASAEISERQTLWSKAAERFETLAKLDPRYRSNYLQKVANLQVRMGQSDAAIQTAQRIIESNPAAPDSYQTFARIAMRAGKDDEAFAALRRAMNVAPRDNSPRRMLASSLAERYRTDEAIELYWQAMRLERDDDAKMELVARLAPLYERKNAIPELIGRIENEERRDEDPRTTQLMIATANETIQDYGAARSIVDKLLAAQPRDPELLKRMVDLSDRAYEIVSAAEYQKRLLKLADTPENRSRLMMLELDAGIIDIETALRRRIAAGVDASRLGSMIRAAASRRDLDSAIAICRATLDDHPDYWDVKLSLAQILVAKIGSSDESKNAGVVTESEQLCDSLLSDDRPLDELPPTRRKTNSPATAAYPPGYTPPDRTSPFYWSSSRYTLARNYGLGNYGRSYGSSANFQLVTPYSFGHCRIIAASLKVACGLKQQPASVLEEFDPVAEAEKVFPIADLDAVETPETILSQKALRDTMNYFRKPRQIRRGNRISYSYASDDDDAAEKRVEQIAWKLAELDPLRHTSDLMTLLAERTPRVLAAIDPDKDAKNDSKKPAEDAKAGSDKSDSEDDEATEELIPLSPARLQALATVVDTQIKNFAESRQKNPKTSPQTVLVWKRLLSTEAELAGDAEMASRYAIEDPDVQREDFNGLYSYMLNFVMLKQYERAEKYLPALLAAARQPGASSSQLSNGLAAGFGPIATAEPFWQKHRFELLDIGLALANTQAVTAQNKRAGRRSSTNNTGGSVRVRVRVPGEGNDTRVTSKMLIGPLSETLANAGDLQQVVAAIPFDKTQDNQSYSSAPQRQTVPKEVIEHLRKIPAEASADERLRREIVTAFAMWWNDGPEAAFPVIERLAQSHPDNLELQIEKARLAYELKRPRQALEALDAIRPLDSRMLVQKEMAAMQLASQLGDSDRAKVAAKRLFGMRLDTQTQLSLAQKLQALDMVDEAKAVLQRTRGGRAKDESTLLAIARQFERSGDKQSAAEVAYSLLKRLDSGRTTSNVDYYRRSAINLLKQAKKLQPLIAQARARVASTPKSVRAKTDLADLLESAGQTKAAQKVWEEIGKQQPTNPRQLLAKAKSLGKAKKQVEACELYLQAFEKDASLIRREFYNFYNTARAAKKKGPILEALAKFPMDRFPDYRVNELMSLTEGVSSKAANDFIAKVLKNPATRDNALASLSQRKDWLESDGARDAVAEALCSQSAYQSNSPLWSVRSYGGEGVINGTLPTFVDAIRTNEDLGKRFESFVKTVRDDKDSAIIGDVELVGALVMLPAAKSTYKEPNAASADDAIGKLEQVYAPELARVDTYGEATEESDDDDNNSVTLSPFVQSNNGLAWQAAQYIKNHPATGENKELVIAAYMKATDGNPATNSFGYSPTRGLVDAYVDAGKVDIARGLLWRRLRDADYDDNNRFNPGYGDYQRISELQAVAGMLGEMKCLLDALVVYETLLGDRESFKSAARWGGSQSLEKQVQTQRDRFRKLLKDEDSIEFLEFLTSAKVISVADLCGGSFQSEMAPDGPLTLALESCVKTEAGRKAIDNLDADLAQRIDEAAEKVDEKTDSNMAIGSRDLRLTRLLIQLIRIADPDNRDADSIARAAEFADQLQPMLDRLGKLEAIDPPDVQAVGRLVGLAQRMRKIDASEIQAIADAWATGLESPVALSEDIDLDLQWRSLQGEAEDSFTTLIDEVIAMDVGAKSKTRSMKLLKLARLAADAGRLDASTRALREAFKEGPPVQAVEQGGADPFGSGSNPFGVRASASMSMGGMGMVGESETEASITTQLGELMNVYSDQLNVQIGARKPKPKSKSKETLDQDTKRQSINAIHAALAAIMMPDAAPQKWFDYGEPESGNQYRDPFGNAGDAGDDSLVPVLARTAKLSGQTEDVIAKLGERFDNNPSALQIGFAILEIAEVGGNKTLFEEWFEPVEVLVSTELPPLDAPAVEATRVQSITTQMQQQTAKKSRLV